ncbi:MEMO1 family protein C4H3.04c [Cyphellophora attinorum]|uniref:MEMO1 family protein C4H3.04c n=1 Tax=Cyphellophora attinorum TaxID=1664694 RepID=A0A0N1H8M8_9EURO|nr:MEMO1 family protein C4H3.04c [Phialophora attinorum]KPI39737.1 MEMO1 family protein C4H3.04c [Phialophora attinorum]
MAVREPDHAGSWYSANGPELTQQLDTWLSKPPSELPLPGSRVVISPHAGFAYSGPAAAYAYKALDLSQAKRIFILHPSHHHHLSTAALPVVQGYLTPLSSDPLPLDLDLIRKLSTMTATTSQNRQIKFNTMSKDVDEAEHSAEMQLPYIHRLLQKLYPDQPTSTYPPLVPIMVGGTSPATEKALGQLLAPYIADPTNAFVISSDFCHWGSRFGYTYYVPTSPSPAVDPGSLPNGLSNPSRDGQLHSQSSVSQGISLRSSKDVPSRGPKIHESIAHVDRACMCAIATGSHDAFLDILQGTGNTVCGRHPIGVFMAGLEEVERKSGVGSNETEMKRRFRFLRYERSSDVTSIRDSSVSYVSAFAVLSLL